MFGRVHKIGAPKGGRVHWMLENLSKEFRQAYCINYNYSCHTNEHNYLFARYSGRALYDVFIIKQTSKHFWRAMYCCPSFNAYEIYSARSTAKIAVWMELLWETYTLNT